MLVSVLPEEIVMVRIQVSSINLVAVDLLKLLFYENKRQFFAFTRNDNEISLILEHDAAGPFKDIASSDVSPMNWRALSLYNDEEVSDGLVNKLLSLLATQHYSIFYLSTCAHDYILVNSDQLEEILCCLSEHLTIDINATPSSEARDHARTSSSYDGGARCSLSIHNSSNHFVNGNVNASEVKVALLAEDLCMHSFTLEEMDRVMKPLIGALLMQPVLQQFFSFAIIGDQISMILSRESAALFKSYIDINLEYNWRAFKVLGDWGFSEIGLVNSLSSCISAAGIDSPLFLSTFSRDFIIVQSDVVIDAQNAFVHAGFNVCS